MKKTILIMFLLLIGLVEASVASLNISWQLSTSALRPSSISTISLTMTNAGTIDLTSIVITSTPGPYVSITSGNKIDLGALPSLSTSQAAISIKIDDNAPSTISFVYLKAEYYSGTSSYEKTFYIPITITRSPILQIINVNFSNDPKPGREVSLSFDLINDGFGDAKDIKVSLAQSSDFIVEESAGEIFINNLAKSESKKIIFPITVSPDISVGTTTIPITITYYDETRSNNYTETKDIGLKITGNVDFIITVNSYSDFYYGHIGKVSLSIANRGSAPANYISIKASSDFGSNEFYIGNLNPDDTETIELSQDLSKSKSNYPVHLILQYRDRFENDFYVDKFIEVTPTNAPFDYNIVIVVVVVLVVVYWLYRRRKK